MSKRERTTSISIDILGMNRIGHKPTPEETEKHRLECFDSWLWGKAKEIVAMRRLEERREAIGKYRRLRSEIERRVKELWRKR